MIMARTFKNILIIKPSSLGDVVMALPGLSALRKAYPDAKISWLIRPEFTGLLEGHRLLDDIIIFDRKLLGKAWFNPRALGSLVSLILRLRRSKFDAVIDLQGLFRTACLGWLSGCRKRFGMAKAREFAHIFYNNKVSEQNCLHMVDYYLKVVKAAGAADIGAEFIFPDNPAVSDSVKKQLVEHGVDPDNYAVFVPGSAHRDKCWPVEKFAALADKLSSGFGWSIIATGTESERQTVEKLKQTAGAAIINFAGLTNLLQLTYLFKSAKLVLSNDTGPGHIAAVLDVPVVLIFGCSNPARVGPYGKSDCVVAVEPDGRGLEFKSSEAKYDIKAITVDEVYKKVCEQIEGKLPQSDNI